MYLITTTIQSKMFLNIVLTVLISKLNKYSIVYIYYCLYSNSIKCNLVNKNV